ncbi:AraC family transcriptional regulator [Xenorhabdus szentirmaii]|uniref:Transcription regulator (AraC family) n=2 Tax=Xenorhabdus szentirmaii TaxID=290112 RepID=W1IW55_9GAMM|nr:MULTISPECIES: AraC family transcriptional regulator [Xenorhabdus]MBD2780470.1 AraC family transcriptional regulator [Xenorhabdus sp. 38]MBD2791229.1 AraC family transcriptional regulator [Xenorhabdus sp. CUL]MBD2799641.1 AraC family transcriptional regulator [Xenorhabdus sp. M]MBD2805404.1 AraC family transcriptional regulator [Xenorhabdus sp. ZM]MBD2819398.1 AraC family transcriptional regulator [Xenorhabdus sp. 42]
MNTLHSSSDAIEIEIQLQKLAGKIAKLASPDTHSVKTAIPQLTLCHLEQPTEPISWLYEPSMMVILQGAKRVTIGDRSYYCDPRQILVTSTNIPTITQVSTASKDMPFFALMLQLNIQEASNLIVEDKVMIKSHAPDKCALALTPTTAPLLDCFNRLLDLLDTPEDIPVLSPLIHKEIIYRLLTSESGAHLQHMASQESPGHQINRTINWLKEHFSESVKIEQLAEIAKMSLSSFHHHFKAVTSMSPLQYQKWLRLHEARRILLTQNNNMSTTAFQVGYESISQFNREYSRLFGAPPCRDIKKFRVASKS